MRFICALGLCAAACTPSFQSASQITDLRILAVQAEPPEALVDLDAGTVPDVQLQILVVDPKPHSDGLMQGQLCFPTDTLQCGTQSLSLPTQQHPVGQPFIYEVRVPGALLVAALQDDKLKGLGGIRVQSTLEVADGDPHGAVKAEKLLLYNAARAGYVPNHNPAIDGLVLSKGAQPSGSLSPGQPLRVQVGETIGLLPTHQPDQAESYCTTDLTGKQICLTEQLVYSFFSTEPGDLDADSAYDPLPGTPPPPDGLVRFTALAAGTGTLWVVVRDGRGGQSWTSFGWTTN